MTYQAPARIGQADPLLYRLSDSLGLKRTTWPKRVRDDLEEGVEARAGLNVARKVLAAGEQEVEHYLDRKAEHDRTQAEGDPLAFEPFDEAAPDIEGLRAMHKAYVERDRLASRRAAAAYGDDKVAEKLRALWAEHALAKITPEMTVGDAAAARARAEVARDLIAQALIANAQASGGSDLERRRLRRRIREAAEAGVMAPTLDDIVAEMSGKSTEQVEAERKAKADRRARDAARKREARLNAQARTGRKAEEVEVPA